MLMNTELVINTPADFLNSTLFDRVGAVLAATAAGAVLAAPYTVELLWGGFNESWIVGKDAGLEVAAVTTLHANAGTCQIGWADVGCLEIEYKYLEMDSRA